MTMPAGWKKSSYQIAGVSEQTLWRNELTKGIFNKKVSEVQTITNYRVMQNDSGILLKDINDIVVMNQHRASQSQYTGASTGRYTRIGFGSNRSTSKTILFVHGAITNPVEFKYCNNCSFRLYETTI